MRFSISFTNGNNMRFSISFTNGNNMNLSISFTNENNMRFPRNMRFSISFTNGSNMRFSISLKNGNNMNFCSHGETALLNGVHSQRKDLLLLLPKIEGKKEDSRNASYEITSFHLNTVH